MINTLIISNNLIFIKNIINNLPNINIYKICTNFDEALEILNIASVNLVLINFLDEDISSSLDSIKSSDIIHFLDYIFILTDDLSLGPFPRHGCIRYFRNYNTLFRMIDSYISIKKKDDIIRIRISNELEYLGYNFSYVGTKYIAEIIYILNSKHIYSNFSLKKDVYPILLKKYRKSYNNIKSNIGRATEIMYYECDENKLKNYLNLPIVYLKPTPTDIINTILNKIRVG